MNKQLQGKDHLISDLMQHIKTFRTKLCLFKSQLEKGDLSHFAQCKSLCENSLTEDNKAKYAADIQKLQEEMDARFLKMKVDMPKVELMANPFIIDPESVHAELQMELIELQCCDLQKARHRELDTVDFYKGLPSEKYPKLTRHARKMICLFGSTYICEQTFSVMKMNKSKLRSRLTDENLENILRTATSQIEPKITEMARTKKCHMSH